MQTKKIYEITFEDEDKDTVLCAGISGREQFVALTKEGVVFNWDFAKNEGKQLFTIGGKNAIQHTDGGFDLSSECRIYTMDSIVVVVNNRKKHGYVYKDGVPNMIHLWRKDYHANHSPYPICLYRDEEGIAHLIYGADWNHIQVMNLDTLQILTADKSLIEADAEERHLKYYSQSCEPNRYPWPNGFDYFYAQLLMSPDRKRFISRGWHWGSSDHYLVFELEKFINEKRISADTIFGGEHLNRPVCWIDAETIAMTYYPYRDESSETKYTELHFYTLGKGNEPVKKFLIYETDEIGDEMYFNRSRGELVILDSRVGIVILDMDGKVNFHDSDFKPKEYDPELDIFLCADDKTIAFYSIDHNV